VRLKGEYYTLLLGEHVPYSFGERCSDKSKCRECYGCFAGCNCGCAVGEQGEEVHIQPITGTQSSTQAASMMAACAFIFHPEIL